MSGIRFTATRSLLYFLVVLSAVLSAFTSAGASDHGIRRAVARTAPAPFTLFEPTAFPEALPDRQATDVKFTVLVTGAGTPTVNLTVRQLGVTVPMADDGKGPDAAAGDHIFSALVPFSSADAKAGRCYDVFASVSVQGTARTDDDGDDDDDAAGTLTLTSPVRTVCATRIPIGNSPSNFGNIIEFTQDGVTARVIADEVLIIVRSNLGDNRLFALAAQVGGTVVGSVPANNLYQIRFASPRTAAQLQQAILTLERNGGVIHAVPNAIGQLQTPGVTPLPTSDPQLASQTNLDRINATRAWRITKGSASTVIAVIDTGGDFDHPDFWSGSTPRFLTDGGGNLVAADCTSGTCAAVTTPATCHATSNCDVGMGAAVDTYGHGTLLGGVATAATDNAVGIAGANWNAPLLSVRYATADSTTTAPALAAAINYASAQGARIISVSTAVPLAYWSFNVCPSVASADAAGHLVVAAAGNDGPSTEQNYPGACAGAMPIANSTVDASVPPLDVLYTGALGSNEGLWVSLAAPGVSVISTARTPAACPTCDASLSSATGYATVGGTSLSAPLAAGAAGLILAKSPSMTNADLRTLLFTTGVPLQAPFAFMHRIDVLAALLTLDLAPTGVNLSPSTCIPDGTDTTAGVSAGTLTTVDPDAGLTGFEYSIVGGVDAAKFGIGGGSLDQLILTDGILSHAAKPSYAVTVRTTDVGNKTFDQNLNVQVCAPFFTIFNDRAAFLAALGVAPAQTQGFEGIAVGTVMNGVEFMPGVSATHNRGLQIFQDPGNHVLFWITPGPTATSAYDISITQTYHAFGFDVADMNPAAGAGTMQVFFQNGQTRSFPLANTTGNETTPVFFGVISTSPVTQVIWNEPLEVGGASCCEETALDNFVANP
jgi:subtilase family protein